MSRRAPLRGAARAPFFAALATVLFVLAGAIEAAADTSRSSIDAAEVHRLSGAHPGALAHLIAGEAEAMEGEPEKALVDFENVTENAPESSLGWRRKCQALMVLGKRTEAIQACVHAIKGEASAMDMRAMVAAFLSDDASPTPGELAQAMRLARRAREVMPLEPYGYAAECDIAERIADARMLERCLGNLRRVAPGHYETVRAEAAAGPHGLTWWVWVAWSAIFLLTFGTLAHAGWRALRVVPARRRVVASVAVLLVAATGWLAPRIAYAQAAEGEGEPPQAPAHQGQMSEWPIDDSDPESSVPTDKKRNRNPLQFGYWLMDLAYKGVQATKRGDHFAAAKYYRAMVKAVPDRSVSYTRLCESYEAAGEWKSALETCAAALTHDGVTIRDYQRYFTVALAKKGALTGEEVGLLGNVIQHLRDDANGKDAADELECQLAVRLEDIDRLQRCTTTLAARAPNDAKTLSYQWALAMKRGNVREAEALLERARSTEMQPEGLEQMERGIASFQAARRRKMYTWGFGGLAILAGIGVAATMASRRRTLARAAS
jgi:tetratricopeptide (TPR) repeat protein